MKPGSNKIWYGMIICALVAGEMGYSKAQEAPKVEATYKLMRKATGSNDSYSSQVMLRGLPAFTCAVKVMEASAYHRGLVDGAKQAGGECHTAIHESKELSVTVRVENCTDKTKWMSTEYVCEKESAPDKGEEEKVD